MIVIATNGKNQSRAVAPDVPLQRVFVPLTTNTLIRKELENFSIHWKTYLSTYFLKLLDRNHRYQTAHFFILTLSLIGGRASRIFH